MTAKSFGSSLVAALAEMEGAAKDKVNPHFKSKYADLGSVIDCIRPVLAKHGLAFTQHTAPSEDGVIVETFIRHESGEKESLGSLYVPANKRDAQGFGSALTYARRYALLTAFGVPTEDDDGNAASKPANDRNGGLKQQLEQSVAQTPKRDLPFPPGPAKNRTELKTLARAFWSDVEGCGDEDQLDILLNENKALYAQIEGDLPAWISGYEKDGQMFDGLGAVIERKRMEFANEAWKRNPVAAG